MWKFLEKWPFFRAEMDWGNAARADMARLGSIGLYHPAIYTTGMIYIKDRHQRSGAGLLGH